MDIKNKNYSATDSKYKKQFHVENSRIRISSVLDNVQILSWILFQIGSI